MTHDEYIQALKTAVATMLTPERTAMVRWLRVTKSHPWRVVGLTCMVEWTEDLPPIVERADPEHVGMMLCKVAAERDGYHFMNHAGGWN
jgi:hypothetical protein